MALTDLVQSANTTNTVTGNHAENPTNAYDGDFATYAGGSQSAQSGQGASTILTSTFDTGYRIANIVARMYAYGVATPPGGSSSAYVKIELYYDNDWHTVYSDTSNPAGSTSTNITVGGGYNNVTKARFTAYAAASGIYGGSASSRVYECQVFRANPNYGGII